MENEMKSNQDLDGGRVHSMVKRWSVLMQDLTPRIDMGAVGEGVGRIKVVEER